MSEHIINVHDDTFEQTVLQSQTPVLVDFWAEWCAPCKQIAPILEELAEKFEDRLNIVKLNIDSDLRTPQKYSVRGIPTLLLFKNGEVVATQVGARPRSQLISWVESNL